MRKTTLQRCALLSRPSTSPVFIHLDHTFEFADLRSYLLRRYSDASNLLAIIWMFTKYVYPSLTCVLNWERLLYSFVRYYQGQALHLLHGTKYLTTRIKSQWEDVVANLKITRFLAVNWFKQQVLSLFCLETRPLLGNKKVGNSCFRSFTGSYGSSTAFEWLKSC